MIIIVGSSGYIGKEIYYYLKKQNEQVIGTYNNNPVDDMYHFDLEKPDLNNLKVNLKNVTHVVISSAIARIDECKKNQKKAYNTNVIGTKKLIQQVTKKNIIAIFLSSDQVFDGKKGNYKELDERNPINVYGEQKKIIEDYLLTIKKPFLIMRLSKIFGLKKADNTLITNWVETLFKDKEIKCAIDQVLSPTYVGDIAKAVEICIKNDLHGVYNVCNPESFSRYELAIKVKQQLQIKSGKIIPCSINDFNFIEQRPPNTSINPSKFINETNFKFMKMQDCIDNLKNIYNL